MKPAHLTDAEWHRDVEARCAALRAKLAARRARMLVDVHAALAAGLWVWETWHDVARAWFVGCGRWLPECETPERMAAHLVARLGFGTELWCLGRQIDWRGP